MNYASYAAINQNVDKKDESFKKLVIAKIGASAGAAHGEVSAEIVEWMFDKIRLQS